MKRLMLAMLMVVGIAVSALAQTDIDFSLGSGPSGASIAYAGGANPLVGDGIGVPSVLGNSTPANSGVSLTCDNCVLNFETGDLTASDGLKWFFGGGGTIEIRGGISSLGIPPGTTLLSGTFVSALVTGSGNSFHVAISQFTDIKDETLANFYGLGPLGVAGWDGFFNLSFSTAVAATAPGAFASDRVYSGDVVNIPVPGEEPLGCRFTGGGVDTDLNWNHELEDGEMIRNGAGNLPEGIDRYQFGGQVGARTAQQPLPSGEWQHHQQRGPSGAFSFHGGTSSAADGTWIADVRCSDEGWCEQARPAPAKQLDFDGVGTFSNLGRGRNAPVFEIPPNVIPEPNGNRDTPFSFHWFEVNIDDLGEPGRLNIGAPDSVECPGLGFGEKSDGMFDGNPLPFTELANCDCPDFYRITIYKGVLSTEVTFLPNGKVDPASVNQTDVIYEAFGYIDGGNLQIHPPTGFDSN